MNQVQRAFNGLGQMTTEWQEHGGAVNTSTSPKVQYAYSEMSGGVNHSRLTSITYPDGYVLTYNYSSGLNDSISRLSSLSDTTGTLESYDYLGSGTVVRRSHPQPNVDLSYVKRGGESSGDAGDEYTGLDRFGRVVDQRWLNPTSGTATDRFQYAYDLVSNRTSRDNLVNTTFGELYAYDDLSQLVSFQRGTLNGTKTGLTGSASRSQSWDTDAVGNFDSVTTDGTAQTRTANKQNEITSISGATTPTYDDNGNMTGDDAGRRFVYDAWNRLVVVKNSGGTTLETFSYDGLNRRVSSSDGTTTTDLYYSSDWQVLSEKVASNYTKRYVWSPVYVDAMVLRDRDTDSNGSLDERLWVQQDANWNVTSLVNGSGNVVERYVYDAYGSVTIYDASYSTVRGSSSYGMTYYWQGRPLDAVSQTYNFRIREVSWALGRPIQVDMLRFGAGDINFYRWEGNDPVAGLDPMGLDEFSSRPKNPKLRDIVRRRELETRAAKLFRKATVTRDGDYYRFTIYYDDILAKSDWLTVEYYTASSDTMKLLREKQGELQGIQRKIDAYTDLYNDFATLQALYLEQSVLFGGGAAGTARWWRYATLFGLYGAAMGYGVVEAQMKMNEITLKLQGLNRELASVQRQIDRLNTIGGDWKITHTQVSGYKGWKTVKMNQVMTFSIKIIDFKDCKTDPVKYAGYYNGTIANYYAFMKLLPLSGQAQLIAGGFLDPQWLKVATVPNPFAVR